MDQNTIQNFFAKIRSQNKLAPRGAQWMDFFFFLKEHTLEGETAPLLPLIRVAPGDGLVSKQLRLEAQLKWAQKNDCLNQAIQFLEKLDDAEWEKGPAPKWNITTF